MDSIYLLLDFSKSSVSIGMMNNKRTIKNYFRKRIGGLHFYYNFTNLSPFIKLYCVISIPLFTRIGILAKLVTFAEFKAPNTVYLQIYISYKCRIPITKKTNKHTHMYIYKDINFCHICGLSVPISGSIFAFPFFYLNYLYF